MSAMLVGWPGSKKDAKMHDTLMQMHVQSWATCGPKVDQDYRTFHMCSFNKPTDYVFLTGGMMFSKGDNSKLSPWFLYGLQSFAARDDLQLQGRVGSYCEWISNVTQKKVVCSD
uniref:Uncharacterized protein n=1 Tax=Ditylenchus dipsaci TaxID=166011 RepID=A0A915DDU9_9BILA